MAENIEFELNEDDLYAVEVAQNVARRLMGHPGASGEQVAGLRHALQALERLPLATPGASYEYAVVYIGGNDEFRETTILEFKVSDNVFEISKGGVVYDKLVGNDTLPEKSWYIELSGAKLTDLDLTAVQDAVAQYLNLGAEIRVIDESEMDVDDTNG